MCGIIGAIGNMIIDIQTNSIQNIEVLIIKVVGLIKT